MNEKALFKNALIEPFIKTKAEMYLDISLWVKLFGAAHVCRTQLQNIYTNISVALCVEKTNVHLD